MNPTDENENEYEYEMGKEREMKTIALIEQYFKENSYCLTEHALQSYDNLISTKIPQLIKSSNPITLQNEKKIGETVYNFEIKLYVGGQEGTDIQLSLPAMDDGTPLYPDEARLRNLNYDVSIVADIEIHYTFRMVKGDKEHRAPTKTSFKKCRLFDLPIMLHSKICPLYNQRAEFLTSIGECSYEKGGYFIVDGKEKAIISQERLLNNKIRVFQNEDLDKNIFSWAVEVRSLSVELQHAPVSFLLKWHKNKQYIRVFIPFLRTEHGFPLFLLFRALGIESDKDILTYIIGEDLGQLPDENDKGNWINCMLSMLQYTIRDGSGIYSQNGAIKFLTGFTKANETLITGDENNITNMKPENEQDIYNYIFKLLHFSFLPHIKMGRLDATHASAPHVVTPVNFKEKAFFVGAMVKQLLLTVSGLQGPSDRDRFDYKKIETPGMILYYWIRELYGRWQGEVKKDLQTGVGYSIQTTPEKVCSNLIRDDNYERLLHLDFMTTNLQHCMKGKCTNILGSMGHQGIVQDVTRNSFLSFISQLRRVHLELDSKKVAPRRLHTTQWGIICPVETPDGIDIGIIKHLSLFTMISQYVDDEEIQRLLLHLGIESIYTIHPEQYNQLTKIFLNGRCVGIHRFPKLLRTVLLYLRRIGMLSCYVSISFRIQYNEIHLITEEGRLMRPLLIVDEHASISYFYNKKKISWKQCIEGKLTASVTKDIIHSEISKLSEIVSNASSSSSSSKITTTRALQERIIQESTYQQDRIQQLETHLNDFIQFLKANIQLACIEYLDTEESNVSLIATHPTQVQDPKTYPQLVHRYTHCEIHPSLILGTMASNIPFIQHNAAAYNQLGVGQSKQAVSVYASSFARRLDQTAHVLHYGERPMIASRYLSYITNNMLTFGNNVIVAIMSFNGFNQEDGFIINRRAVERGMYISTTYHTFDCEETPLTLRTRLTQIHNSNGTEFEKDKNLNYAHLDEYGIVKIGSVVQEYDVLIRCSAQRPNQNKWNDCSIAMKHDTKGIVDKIYIQESEHGETRGYRIVKIRIREIRHPEVGDKFSSRHGNKGTIGIVMNEEDIPFTRTGLKPDIIINPHQFPKRMLAGQLLEHLFGKLACMMGTPIDATPFASRSNPASGASELLQQFDFQHQGEEILYNGLTGEQMETDIYIGVVFWMRLRHMPIDKLNARSTGPLLELTRQPQSGRAQEGGLRIGGMEKDAILAHGIGSFMKETMFDRCDPYSYDIETEYGNIFIPTVQTEQDKQQEYREDDNNKPKNRHETSTLHLPYAFKLLQQEVETGGISMKLIVEPNAEFDI